MFIGLENMSQIKIEDYLQALKELNRKIPNPTESTFDG